MTLLFTVFFCALCFSDDVPISRFVALLGMGSVPVRLYLLILYQVHFRIAESRRARHFWSLSFWDVPKANKTLSRIPFSVPLYFFVFDLATSLGSFATVKALFGRDNLGLLRLLSIITGIGSTYRALFQLFLQMQWTLGTLEYRFSSRPSQRLYARLGASISKYIASSFQANWTGLGMFFFVALWGGVLLPFAILQIVPKLIKASPNLPFVWWLIFWTFWVVIILINLGFIAAFLILLFLTPRDLVRRARWVYERDRWAYQAGGGDRDIQLA